MMVLVISFVLIANFTKFYEKEKRESVQQEQKSRKEAEVIEAVTNIQEIEEKKVPSIYFLTNRKSESQEIIKAQLKNLKETYEVSSSLSKIERKKVELLIVDLKTYTTSQVNQLKKWNDRGVPILFLGIPNDKELTNKTLKELLGIKDKEEAVDAKGIRLSGTILFDSIQEEEREIDDLPYMVLGKQTEVFVHALLEDKTIKNEELPPLFWRHQQSSQSGSVYVLANELSEDIKGYIYLTNVLEDVRGSYLYPIINAYCVAVKDMPYLTNFESEALDKLYGRDSLSIQFDIFMPQFLRLVDKYGVKLTLYSKEYNQVQNSSDERMEYYLEKLEENGSEIAHINNQEKMEVASSFQNQLISWNLNSSFQEQEVNQVDVPILQNNFDEIDQVLSQNIGSIRTLGFASMMIPMDDILHPNGEQTQDWNRLSEQIETVLGTEEELYPWIDRVTVSEAIQRIQILKIMQLNVQYSEDGIQVKIKNFAQRAWFYLFTSKEIKDIQGGEITQISDDMYLIKATGDSIKIEYRK